jgi:single-stranded-DNA-specific exonuclease
LETILDIPAAPWAPVRALVDELGVSTAFAQVLVRRGLTDAERARAFLAAADEHDPALLGDMAEGVAVIARHVAAGTRITVHGDYDCDGVTSTAILVGTLRALGADVDWFLPSRTEDGYGLRPATVERLAARGTRLLVTVDCGITSVEEVAAARAAGLDVVVTDHHQPRADGLLPDAPLVHPGLARGGRPAYPCPELCAAGVAYKLAQALLAVHGRDPAEADRDLDLVALATVADCVPLVGENRRLVRDGLAAIAATRRPGLRALMRVAELDPGAVDARALGFRLGPRLNAAGRVHRADAGVELMLTDDAERAGEIAAELDSANGERKHLEQRIRFEAEAQLRDTPDAAAYVLAGDGWHPGVIGIVASRLAEETHRPVLMIALDGDTGTGSGRSIPAFDLLAGLDACAAHLLRHGGHRAAAGCTVARGEVDALRAAFVAHAEAVLTPADLVPHERVDAIVAGDELGMALCEELGTLEPFGIGNPEVSLLVPGAQLTDVRTMGEGKHMRFTVRSGGARASAVAFGRGSLPPEAADGLDATFVLERNEWNGAVEARLRLRTVTAPAPAPIATLPPDDETADPLTAVFAAYGEPAAVVALPRADDAPSRTLCDRRGAGLGGTLAALVATGEPVLVVAADAPARRRALDGRFGGFTLTDHEALSRRPGAAEAFVHVVALDPPATAAEQEAIRAGGATGFTHLAWGEPELGFAEHVLARRHDLRPPLAALFRGLRDAARPDPDALTALLLADGRSPHDAAALLRVLHELALADVDPVARTVVVRPDAPRVELDGSATYRAHRAHLEEGRAWLSRLRPRLPQAA